MGFLLKADNMQAFFDRKYLLYESHPLLTGFMRPSAVCCVMCMNETFFLKAAVGLKKKKNLEE